jgi:undecaprenyl phosphate N,N'-diacetylbacillosamine 1-phosphate transferase
MYKQFLKPVFDFIFGIGLIIILLPLLIIVFLILLISLREFPIFFQQRPGKNEQIFTMMKFKTMRSAEYQGFEPNLEILRMTKASKFIRDTSLDELPELFNVLKGDMSIIGPRPLLVEYLLKYNKTQRKRHEVKPGITGLAQINGRNSLSWEEKFIFDIEYVENISFLLDLKILTKTIIKVLKRSNIDNNGQMMDKFKGEDK